MQKCEQQKVYNLYQIKNMHDIDIECFHFIFLISIRCSAIESQNSRKRESKNNKAFIVHFESWFG